MVDGVDKATEWLMTQGVLGALVFILGAVVVFLERRRQALQDQLAARDAAYAAKLLELYVEQAKTTAAAMEVVRHARVELDRLEARRTRE